MPTFLGVWSLGLFSLTFFSTSSKKKKAMEAMNQNGQPWNSGKRGPMWPAPLTSGGLALEEVTCRGWGPHL